MTCTCRARDTHHMSGCALADTCPRGCPEGECYCTDPTYADFLTCSSCGSDDGDCYCGED